MEITTHCNYKAGITLLCNYNINSSHQEFQCYSAGFVINQHYPHLGASPNTFVKCIYCGKGKVETKCPFSDRKSNPNMLKN